MASLSAPKEKPLRRWSSAMIEYFIVSLEDCKSEVDYKNADFISDVIALFSRIRQRMAIKFVFLIRTLLSCSLRKTL